MNALQKHDFIDRAVEVLKENDQGGYTIPTKGLYPYQWNWDSCLTALGQAHYDEARGRGFCRSTAIRAGHGQGARGPARSCAAAEDRCLAPLVLGEPRSER